MPFQAGEWYQACRAIGPATSTNAPHVDRHRTLASCVFLGVGPIVSAEVARDRPSEGRLTELYTRHGPGAQRLAFLLTGERGQAEDLVQEAFVRVVGRFGHLRVPDAFEAYLRRTIVNLHTSQLRRKRLERVWLERERGRAEHVVDVMPDVGTSQDLWRALLELPARQRAVVVLRFYEDLSERETAEVLGCSPAAAKSLTARAMETLRARIGRQDA
jgi:RNA polymerase sigma-70 factor (sigma-E family)